MAVCDSFAWIHGDYSNDIGQTWLGMVGPGVERNGIDQTTWTDHTDVVPTMDALLGLTPDYRPDGRVITQILESSANPHSDDRSFTELGALYKQLNAPYGDFAHSLIVASTNGIEGTDTIYLSTEQEIQQLAARRDGLVERMKDVLGGLDREHTGQLLKDGRRLLDAATQLAGLPVDDDERTDQD